MVSVLSILVDVELLESIFERFSAIYVPNRPWEGVPGVCGLVEDGFLGTGCMVFSAIESIFKFLPGMVGMLG